MQDRPSLSNLLQNTSIPAMETPSTRAQNLHINLFNSTTLFPNLDNISTKKSSNHGSYDVCSSVKGNEDEPDESNHFSESKIPTYNRFEVLDKLSKDPSDKTAAVIVNDENFELPPVPDSEYIKVDSDSDMKPEERKIIDEINVEQLRTYLSEQLKPVKM